MRRAPPSTAPAVRRAVSHEPDDAIVSGSRLPPPAAQNSSIADTYEGVVDRDEVGDRSQVGNAPFRRVVETGLVDTSERGIEPPTVLRMPHRRLVVIRFGSREDDERNAHNPQPGIWNVVLPHAATDAAIATADGRPMGRLDELDLTAQLSNREYEARLSDGQRKLLARCGWISADISTIPISDRASSASSRAPTPPARAAPSAAWSSRSTRATTECRRSRSRHSTRSASTSCGGSGTTYPGSAASPCSTAAGTDGCWSNASKGTLTTEQWQRAYDEIVQFERNLVVEGLIIVKFWVQVSPEEQLARFQSREQDPLRRWKLTEEDWRNRVQDRRVPRGDRGHVQQDRPRSRAVVHRLG